MGAIALADISETAQLWEYGDEAKCAVETGLGPCRYDAHNSPYLSAYMPPLTVYLWVGLLNLFGASASAAYVLINVAIGAACAPALYWLSRKLGLSQSISIAAGALVACYPTFVYVSSSYHATNFTVLLLLLSMVATLHAMRTTTLRSAVVAGGVGGLLALTRTEMLIVAGTAAVLILYARRQRLLRAIASALACTAALVLVISPWAIRNYIVFDRLIPVANSSGYNLWKAFGPLATGSGNQLEASKAGQAAVQSITAAVTTGDFTGDRYESRVQDAFADQAGTTIAESSLSDLAILTLRKLTLLLSFDWTDSVTHSAMYLTPWLLINVMAVFGLVAVMRYRMFQDRFAGIVVSAVILVLIVSYAISSIHSRYRMHIEPIEFIFAAVTIAHLGNCVRERLTRLHPNAQRDRRVPVQ